jgi:hypothetical protein
MRSGKGLQEELSDMEMMHFVIVDATREEKLTDVEQCSLQMRLCEGRTH